ncbi:PREDICTED: putative pentatricopeptide repeat-containing protein At1g56570 [Nelumbo nucifera]|uniref:Pentatricopeptide repeat-containing protein At1g56570 n=2 Tax=Nelumbo nucifera TaxID=4432 RepID=A0A822Z4D5_NELNU|nr:PREDICTED: putative pentatricopeptide repeat-containing protein At1g56570 [Nelumbo nucifera]DAD38355.1 TPA_asm: hypothetical protein HUJ06_008996 [Nelumbo nucifera]
MNISRLLSNSHFPLVPPHIRLPLVWTRGLAAHHSNDLHLPIPTEASSILATKLVTSYFHRGRLEQARKLFDEIPNRDVVLWTAMISGYTSRGLYSNAWAVFCQMTSQGMDPNEFTISSVLKACKGMESCSCGLMVHGLALKHGLDGCIYVENTLMDMYATCCPSMDDAYMVFRHIREKNAVSWTTMITGYTHRGDVYGGLQVFRRMIQEGVDLNPFSCSIAIRACASIGIPSFGKQMHVMVIKCGFDFNLPVANSLLDMYCRCNSLSEAKRYFHEIPQKDLITWNTLIAGYEKSGSDWSLNLFLHMLSEGLSPNCFTFTSVIAACANLALLNCGEQIHGGIFQRGLQGNLPLDNALIDMYAKCGCVDDSRRIFDEMPQRDLVSWTSMMMGYGTHGYGKEAIGLFNKMLDSGIRPDQIVFMGVLSACSHAGLVSEGLNYFNSMATNYHVTPNQEIYGCVVDLLGRAGRIKEAYQLIEAMPFKPDVSVWSALLGACKAHGDSNLGRLAAQKILSLRPNGADTYVILSNIYAADGKWGEFAKVRKLMRGIGCKKEAGVSWIEVGNQVYSFVVGDKVGSHIEMVYRGLEMLVQHMKEVGNDLDSDCLLHLLEDES